MNWVLEVFPFHGLNSKRILSQFSFMALQYAFSMNVVFAATPCDLMTEAGQHVSLSAIYYKGNPLPPRLNQGEIRIYEEMLPQLAPHESKFLEDTLQNDELRRLATKDTDNDGMPDYRIACNGKYIENDTDVDGDGVFNILELEPYDKNTINFEDDNQNEIPDHLDWMHAYSDTDADIRDEVSAIQKSLYDEFDVMLVERSAEFPLVFAEIIQDLVSIVFKNQFALDSSNASEKRSLNALRFIVTERASSRESGDEITSAEVHGQNASMVIYSDHMCIFDDDCVSKLRLIDFGTIAHEFVHSYQFSIDQDCQFPVHGDCDDTDFNELKRFNIVKAPEFHALINNSPFGWTVSNDLNTVETYQFVMPHDDEISPTWNYLGQAPQLWKSKLDSLWNSHYTNDGDHDSDGYWDELKEIHIVGEYSMLNPWEWQAEYMVAYLFLGMEDYLQKHWDNHFHDDIDTAQDKFEHLVKDSWNHVFFYGNAKHNDPVLAWYRINFPLDDEEWQHLANTYLIPAYEYANENY